MTLVDIQVSSTNTCVLHVSKFAVNFPCFFLNLSTAGPVAEDRSVGGEPRDKSAFDEHTTDSSTCLIEVESRHVGRIIGEV